MHDRLVTIYNIVRNIFHRGYGTAHACMYVRACARPSKKAPPRLSNATGLS